MLFGKRHLKLEKKRHPVSVVRSLLPLTVLLVFCSLVFVLNPPWRTGGERERDGATADPSTRSSTGSGQSSPVDSARPRPSPTPPQDPEPFVEKPEVLGIAATQDRTKELSETAIAYLFQKMRTDPAGFAAEEPVLSLDRDDIVWDALQKDPDMHRGRLIVVKGRVIASRPNEYPLRLAGLDVPNPSGLDRRFESFLLGTDGKFYLVTTFKKADDLQHQDAVRLRAYFCQLYTNEVEHNGKVKLGTIPFLVGEDYEVIDQGFSPPAGSPLPFIIILVGLPILAFIVIFALHLRTQKKFRRLQTRRAATPRRDQP